MRRLLFGITLDAVRIELALPEGLIWAHEILGRITWTPKTEPVLMRASLSARFGQEKPMKRKCHNPEQIIRKLRSAAQLLNQG